MQRAAEAWVRIHAVKKRIHPGMQRNLPWRIPRETGKGGDRRHLGTLIPAFFSMESKEKRAVGPSFWTEEDGTAAMGSLLSSLLGLIILTTVLSMLAPHSPRFVLLVMKVVRSLTERKLRKCSSLGPKVRQCNHLWVYFLNIQYQGRVKRRFKN